MGYRERCDWLEQQRAEVFEQRNHAGRLYWRMRAERDKWQAIGEFYESWHIDLSNCCFEKSMELHTANARIAELEADLVMAKAQLAARDKRTCDTCRHFHAGTYTCRSEWAPLQCVLNGYDQWQERE